MQEMPEVKDAAFKFKQRDVEGALKLLKEAAKKNPDIPPAWVVITQWFVQSNMGQAAQNALERAVMESPNDPQAYTVMGDIAIQQRRFAEARLDYDKANSLLSGFSGSAKRKAALQTAILSGLARWDQMRRTGRMRKRSLNSGSSWSPESRGPAATRPLPVSAKGR